MSAQNPFRLVLIAVFIACVVVTANSQTVTYDWSSGSKTPESYPTITRRQNVRIQVRNINNILYTYRLEVTQTPLDTDDFAFIKGLFPHAQKNGPGPGGPQLLENCVALENNLTNALDKATAEINADEKLPNGYAAAKSDKSIPLKESIEAWESHSRAIAETRKAHKLLAGQGCLGSADPNLLTDYENFETAVTNIQKTVDGPHIIEQAVELGPGSHVSVTVIEMFGGKTISTKTFEFDTTDVLTLSAGAMFSRIQDRTYEARKDPTSTLNTLIVEGNSQATPSLVALLNYSLGVAHLDWERAGFALSAGPVLRVGGQSDASSFGFFTGISGHLYRRIFFTPGFHFGQFADFPVGFANGSSVPANFGELTPVKRWTARFGLAITFKTKSFDAFGTSDKNVGDEGGGEPKPKEKEPEGGENGSNSAMVDAATALRLVRSRARSSRELPNLPARDLQTETRGANPSQPLQPAISDTAQPLVYVSASPAAEAVTHITSLVARTFTIAADERVSIETSTPVRDYSMYFKAGRFYLVLPRAKLDTLQDGLQGQTFSDVVIEKRGSDLVLSFALRLGTTTRVVERPSGLDVVFGSVSPAQE